MIESGASSFYTAAACMLHIQRTPYMMHIKKTQREKKNDTQCALNAYNNNKNRCEITKGVRYINTYMCMVRQQRDCNFVDAPYNIYTQVRWIFLFTPEFWKLFLYFFFSVSSFCSGYTIIIKLTLLTILLIIIYNKKKT